MSIMLICTLGNRDLKLSGELIKPAREKGKEILDNFDSYSEQLSFPIINQVLNYIFNDEKHLKIDRLILIATDQDELKTKPEYRQNDTIQFARILKKRLLPQRYGQKINDIKILPITKNPAYLDAMFHFFKDELLKNAFEINNLDICYVEQTGGIPAANMALLYQSIAKFKDKCQALYVTEVNNVFQLSISKIILNERRKSLLPYFVENYNYVSLCSHLNNKKEDEKFMFRLCEYAQHRLHFDMDKARIIARKAMGEFYTHRDFLEEFILELEKLENKDQVSLILELFYNIKIMYHRKEFVDFLGRIYRFQEAVLRFIIESEFSISTEKALKSNKPNELIRFINNKRNEYLKKYIHSQKTPDGENIDPNKYGVPLFNAILNYIITEKDKKKYQIIYEIFHKNQNKLVSLIRIRNKSIIGHGFTGVSEEIIKQNYEGDIIEDLRKVIVTILEKPPESIDYGPFEKINDKLLEKMHCLY